MIFASCIRSAFEQILSEFGVNYTFMTTFDEFNDELIITFSLSLSFTNTFSPPNDLWATQMAKVF